MDSIHASYTVVVSAVQAWSTRSKQSSRPQFEDSVAFAHCFVSFGDLRTQSHIQQMISKLSVFSASLKDHQLHHNSS